MSAYENFVKHLSSRQLNVTVIIVFTKKHNCFNTFDSNSKGAQDYKGENTISQLISPFASVRLDKLTDVFEVVMIIWGGSVVARAFPFKMLKATIPVIFRKAYAVSDCTEKKGKGVLRNNQMDIFAK